MFAGTHEGGKGLLDHLAIAEAESVHASVNCLLLHTESNAFSLLREVDASGKLSEADEARMVACAAEVLPKAAVGKAFFTNWDSTYMYDMSKATPVPLSATRDEVVGELLKERGAGGTD